MLESLAYKVARLLRKTANAVEGRYRLHSFLIKSTMSIHDMVANPDERYYREQYWLWLRQACEESFPGRDACAIDLGCGQGRLAIPLAEWLTKGRVIGIDMAEFAIAQARDYAKQKDVDRAEFRLSEVMPYLAEVGEESVDLVVMCELAFFFPQYKDALVACLRVLKPSGLLFVSFRSQYFNLLASVRQKDWSSARLVRDVREGHWGAGCVWYSWHTCSDVLKLLTDVGFRDIRVRGIGIASGMDGDPLSVIAQPSRLGPTDASQLMEVEVSLAEQYADCGRYILATARK